jgi:hypothetical protein
MPNKVVRFILKQYDTGLWFGAANSLITNSISIAAPFTPLIGLGTFYGVWRDTITSLFPWLTVYVVTLALGLGVIAVLLLEWKVIIPAKMRYNNWISAKHGNVVRQDIEKLRKENKIDIERIEKKLDSIAQQLNYD